MSQCLLNFNKIKSIKHPKIDSGFLAYYSKIRNFEFSKPKVYKFIKESYKYSSLLSTLARSYLYYISGNKFKSHMILLEITKVDLLSHALEDDLYDVSSKDKEKIFFEVLDFFKDEELKEKVFENLINYFIFSSSKEFSKKIEKRYRVNLNINSIRKKYKSPVYGSSYPFIWGVGLYLNSSSSELFKYLETAETFKSKSYQNLLFLRDNESLNKDQRDFLFKVTDKRATNFYQHYLYYELLADETLYKTLSAHNKLRRGLLLNQKRKFFKENLKKVKNSKLSLFYLFHMGDINYRYLKHLKSRPTNVQTN